MRKNTLEVWQSWQQGKANRKHVTVWTDGKHIYSYQTCIMALDDDGQVVMNMTRYSVTTTLQQNALIVLCNHIRKREMYALPAGCSPEQVIDRPGSVAA